MYAKYVKTKTTAKSKIIEGVASECKIGVNPSMDAFFAAFIDLSQRWVKDVGNDLAHPDISAERKNVVFCIEECKLRDGEALKTMLNYVVPTATPSAAPATKV